MKKADYITCGYRWLETVEYSDGMGEAVLTKVQAEPDRDGNERWVGTGRTVLNNKGNPVKQYEPYFSDDDEWETESEARDIGVTPIMHYDPLSRLIRTDFPDGTHSKVEFTPWIQKDYDQNDTTEGNPHYNTPTITHLDSLGRPFCVETTDGKSVESFLSFTYLDIEGNEKKIVDARENTVMKYKYGIHGEKAYTKSMDAGERWMLLAVDEQPIYTWDSRKHKLHIEYDELRRPTKQWLNDEILVGETFYGESESNTPEDNNLRGQVWKVYDQSGEVVNVKYDFKDNLLESKRRLTQEYKQTINWNVNPELENETFTTITAYDAQNRATSIKAPHSNVNAINEILPEYDDGGLLKGVKAKLRGSAQSTDFVTNITYNPKGQRERICYGNNSTTRYEYDEKTFRLTNILTTRNSGADTLQDLNYTYDPVGNITQITDSAQEVVFFDNQLVNPSQTFEYDALYRLTKATGREHANNAADMETLFEGYPHAYTSIPNDTSALRNYTRKWKYDEVGNILKLIHCVNNGSGNWNRSYEYEPNNNQLMSTTVGDETANYEYNEHGSMKKMPHLEEMTWDFAERLCYVERGTTKAYYNYDGGGERVRKVVEKGSIVETRLYLGGFEIYRKKTGNNLVLERETLHVMDDTKRVALVETLTVGSGTTVPVLRYQLSNNIESATLELDENASIISYEEYYPYGDTSYQAGRSVSEVRQKRYRYTGKEKDEESGLYYYGARYYDPIISMFLSSDPLFEMKLWLSPYHFCSNNPMNRIDPTGKIDYPLKGDSAVNKIDYADGGFGLTNTVVRTSTYEEIRNIGSSPHIGIDYRASIGTPVYSLGDGTVVHVDTNTNTKTGKFVTIEYNNDDRIRFLHMNSFADGIVKDAKVYEGQIIGESGNTGGYVPHLHVDGKDKDGKSINPEQTKYGTVDNKTFFGKFGGDYKKLLEHKQQLATNESALDTASSRTADKKPMHTRALDYLNNKRFEVERALNMLIDSMSGWKNIFEEIYE